MVRIIFILLFCFFSSSLYSKTATYVNIGSNENKSVEIMEEIEVFLPKQFEPEELLIRDFTNGQISNNEPNDYYYPNSQYYWKKNIGHGIEEAYTLLKDKQTKKVKIAILDSGMYPNPDIEIKKGYNFTDNLKLGDTVYNKEDCDSTHGGSVASIIGSKTNNAYGMAGIVDSDIFMFRVLECNGKGKISNIINALNFIIEKNNYLPTQQFTNDGVFLNENYSHFKDILKFNENIDVINLSFSFVKKTCPEDLQNIINKGTENGIVFVASSGNYGKDLKNRSPANCKNVISVGSVDKNKNVSNFSNFGDSVDIYAMGEKITVAYKGDINFALLKGTSFSAPIVSGIIGMIKSVNSNFKTKEIMDILINSADIKDGNKIINAEKAIKNVLSKESIVLYRVIDAEGAVVSNMIKSIGEIEIGEKYIIKNNSNNDFVFFDENDNLITLKKGGEKLLEKENFYYIENNDKKKLTNLLIY